MKQMVYEILAKYNIDTNVIERYDEAHRFYHNWEHIEFMLNNAIKFNMLTDELLISIVFHDIVYNPKRSDNEEKSVELLKLYYNNSLVEEAILDTKTHTFNVNNKISQFLSSLDLMVLNNFDLFVDFEKNIFKEYQFVDYNTYKTERIKVLKSLVVKDDFINYVKYRDVKIGLYAGSFNPFHKGHLNILEKAEQIFDKVIIARGVNPSKNNEIVDLPELLKFHQVEYYDGLLTDFINTLGYDVTLIRGLRNATDLEYEKTQYRFLKDLKSDIKVVNILSDPEFEHISSSAIRTLEKYNKSNLYKI